MSVSSTYTVLETAMAEFKPKLVSYYVEFFTGQLARVQLDLGVDCKGASNDWRWARLWTTYLRNLMDVVAREPVTARALAYKPNPKKIAELANGYADATIDTWKTKILVKLGELEEAVVARLGVTSFKISGTRAGRKVEIIQEMIVNVSVRGQLYNQFPARIYLDGKPISAANYAASYAEGASS